MFCFFISLNCNFYLSLQFKMPFLKNGAQPATNRELTDAVCLTNSNIYLLVFGIYFSTIKRIV